MKVGIFIMTSLLIFPLCIYAQDNSQTDFTTYKAKHIPIQLQILQKRASNPHDIDALFELGIFYIRGVDITRDIPKAIHYFTLAAEQHHPKALYNLASLYLDGTIIEQDITQGLLYLEEAVALHYIPAQVAYAFLYVDGRIVQQDIEKAYTYLARARYNPNITPEELREITNYKNNLAKKLPHKQILQLEHDAKHYYSTTQ